MALIVEDGTGLADAESYVTLTAFRQYHTRRSRSVYNSTADDVCESYLIQAFDFIEAIYGSRFRGLRRTSVQAGAFPRSVDTKYADFREMPALPVSLIKAQCELAHMAASGPLAGYQATADSPSSGDLASAQAGSVAVSWNLRRRSRIDERFSDRFHYIESLLAPLLQSGSGNIVEVARS